MRPHAGIHGDTRANPREIFPVYARAVSGNKGGRWRGTAKRLDTDFGAWTPARREHALRGSPALVGSGLVQRRIERSRPSFTMTNA